MLIAIHDFNPGRAAHSDAILLLRAVRLAGLDTFETVVTPETLHGFMESRPNLSRPDPARS